MLTQQNSSGITIKALDTAVNIHTLNGCSLLPTGTLAPPVPVVMTLLHRHPNPKPSLNLTLTLTLTLTQDIITGTCGADGVIYHTAYNG